MSLLGSGAGIGGNDCGLEENFWETILFEHIVLENIQDSRLLKLEYFELEDKEISGLKMRKNKMMFLFYTGKKFYSWGRVKAQ